jgi:hypothetical protein
MRVATPTLSLGCLMSTLFPPSGLVESRLARFMHFFVLLLRTSQRITITSARELANSPVTIYASCDHGPGLELRYFWLLHLLGCTLPMPCCCVFGFTCCITTAAQASGSASGPVSCPVWIQFGPSSDPSCPFGGRGSLGPLRGGPFISVLCLGRGHHLLSSALGGLGLVGFRSRSYHWVRIIFRSLFSTIFFRWHFLSPPRRSS